MAFPTAAAARRAFAGIPRRGVALLGARRLFGDGRWLDRPGGPRAPSPSALAVLLDRRDFEEGSAPRHRSLAGNSSSAFSGPLHLAADHLPDGPTGSSSSSTGMAGRHRRLLRRPRLRPPQAHTARQPRQDDRRERSASRRQSRRGCCRQAAPLLSELAWGEVLVLAVFSHARPVGRSLRVGGQAYLRSQGVGQHFSRPRRRSRPHRQPGFPGAACTTIVALCLVTAQGGEPSWE
jgi:hypothetical protein